MSEQYTISIVVEGEDKGATSALDSVGGSLRRVGEFVVGGLLVGGIQKVGQAFSGLAKNAIGSVSNVQMLEKSMQGMLAQNLMYEEVTNSVTVATSLSAKQQEQLLKAQIKLAGQTDSLNKLREKGAEITSTEALKLQLLESQAATTANTIERLSGVEGGFATVTSKAIQQTRSFEEANTLAAAEVQDLLRFVEKLSIISPFETADVEQVTKIGLAARLSTGMVKDFTAAFLDTAAVMGITDIQFAADQFLQLKQAGALTTIDLRQLRRMGIDVARIIGTDMSGSIEDATDRFGELSPAARKVFGGMDLDIKSFNATAKDSPEVLDAIFQKFILLSEQTSAGAAAGMATTVTGMMGTAADIIEIGSRKLFRPILEAVGPPLAGVLDKLADFATGPEITQIGENIGKAVTTGIKFFERFIKAINAGFVPLDAFKFAIRETFRGDVAKSVVNIINAIQEFIKLTERGIGPLRSLHLIFEQFAPENMAGDLMAILEPFIEFFTLIDRGIPILESLHLTFEQFAPTEIAGNLMAIVEVFMQLRDTLTDVFNFAIEHKETIANVIVAIGTVLAAHGIAAAFTAIGAAIMSVATVVIPMLVAVIGTLLSPLSILLGLVTLVAVAWSENWFGMQEVLTPVIDTIVTQLQRVPEILEIWGGIFEKLPEVIGIVWDDIVSSTQESGDELTDNISSTWFTMQEDAQVAWDAMVTLVSTEIAKVITAVKDKVSDMTQAGKDLISGVASGITEGAGAVVSAVTSAIRGALKKAKEILGISSPSIVMANIIGKPMAQGVGVGWMKQMPMLGNTMGKSLQATAQQTASANTNFDQRSFGGDTFEVQANDQGAMEMFLGFVEERKTQRLNASMGY